LNDKSSLLCEGDSFEDVVGESEFDIGRSPGRGAPLPFLVSPNEVSRAGTFLLFDELPLAADEDVVVVVAVASSSGSSNFLRLPPSGKSFLVVSGRLFSLRDGASPAAAAA
jgi:hypothetical protein